MCSREGAGVVPRAPASARPRRMRSLVPPWPARRTGHRRAPRLPLAAVSTTGAAHIHEAFRQVGAVVAGGVSPSGGGCIQSGARAVNGIADPSLPRARAVLRKLPAVIVQNALGASRHCPSVANRQIKRSICCRSRSGYGPYSPIGRDHPMGTPSDRIDAVRRCRRGGGVLVTAIEVIPLRRVPRRLPQALAGRRAHPLHPPPSGHHPPSPPRPTCPSVSEEAEGRVRAAHRSTSALGP